MSSDRRKQLVLYGIKNCDSCRKAQSWLKSHQAAFTFLDVRDDGLPEARMKGWLESPQGSKLLNRRSTSWRNLSEAERSAAEKDPLSVLLANPTLIKRPLVTAGGELLAVGFSPADFEKLIQE